MQKQNILLITSDQQHWFTIGLQNPEVKTPNLDRLAKMGTLFNRAYTCNPTCTPTRASIITGLYPSQHGAYSLGTKLPEHVETVGEIFQKEGYRTSLVGKAHFQQLLDTEEYSSLESNPLQQDLKFWENFDTDFYGFQDVALLRNHTNEFHVGQHYGLWMKEKGLSDYEPYFHKYPNREQKDQHTWSLPEKFHYNHFISDTCENLLDEYKTNHENFFMWASFPDPHPPYLVPEPWASMYDPKNLTIPTGKEDEHTQNPPHFQKTQEVRPDFSMYKEEDGNTLHGFGSHLHDKDKIAKNIAIYYCMISFMDAYIGKILDKLEALDLHKNTLVVFSTDHGHFYGHHGLVAKGAFHYEDMVKVPFIVAHHDKVKQGVESEAMQSLVDLSPSFLSFCGIDTPRTMTGLDQTQVWSGEKTQVRDHVIVENHHNPTTMNARTYIDKQHKITLYYNQSYGELFDLEKDPEEFNNLWDNPDSKDLKSELLLKYAHAELAKEPMWMPRVSAA